MAFIKPIFQSSFIQTWLCAEWTGERWTRELTMLRQAGINEIIIQTTADTKTKTACYHTRISGWKAAGVDMLENLLTVADALDFKVRLGLGSSDDWWAKARDPVWLAAEAAANIAVFDDIVTHYGRHSSIAGWYLWYEFSQATAVTRGCQQRIRSFFHAICRHIRDYRPTSIMAAPFYSCRSSWPLQLGCWAKVVRNIVGGSGIDILALQDSVGVGYNTLSRVEALFKCTKEATDSIGVSLYADIETFLSQREGNQPADQTRIVSQLTRVQPYVRGYVAFSVDHFQNGNEPAQAQGYQDYLKYFLTQR